MFVKQLIKGDSLNFSVNPFSDSIGRSISYPEWTLQISFRGNGATLDATAGSNWAFAIPSASTNTLPVGECFYEVYAVKIATSERITIDRGRITITPNLSSATGPELAAFDDRSQTKKDLEAVRALIRQVISSGGAVEYRIGNRQMKKYDLSELRIEEQRLVTRLVNEERAERIAKGLGDPKSVYVRFS